MNTNQSSFKLDEVYQEVLFTALFDQDTTPNKALEAAAERYNKLPKRP